MNTVKQLVETIKEGIQEKKGQDIVIADLTEIDGSIAKYFIICQGGSPTQVEAIAGSVGDIVRKNLKEKPVNRTVRPLSWPLPRGSDGKCRNLHRSEEHTSELQSP